LDKVLALFDFDGTITTKDTLLELIKFHKGKSGFYAGLLQLSPYVALQKAGVINAQQLKEKFISFFWKGISAAEFKLLGESFVKEKLPAMLRPLALAKIAEYKKLKYEVAIVSASAEEWVKPFCDAQGITCISTRLEKKDGRLTGKLDGKNCNKEEKVQRVELYFGIKNYQQIIAFGDTSGDLPMLAIASESNFKPFR